jgi:hypothetical protein
VEQSQDDVRRGVIATLSGITRFHTFRVRGVAQGHKVGALIDGGATHNFINVAWVTRHGIPTEECGEFIVVVAGDHSMECTR